MEAALPTRRGHFLTMMVGGSASPLLCLCLCVCPPGGSSYRPAPKRGEERARAVQKRSRGPSTGECAPRGGSGGRERGRTGRNGVEPFTGFV